jgi:PEP-CTERM motif
MNKNMLSISIAVAFTLFSAVAKACYSTPTQPCTGGTLTVTAPTPATGTATNFNMFSLGSPTFSYGTLTATQGELVTFTFLGASAGYTNYFGTSASPQLYDNHTTAPGTSTFTEIAGVGGVLDFQFSTSSADVSPGGYSVANGSNLTSSSFGAGEGVFGIVQGIFNISGVNYQDLLIYNDPVSGGDQDFNDMIIGVNACPTSPVPEPKTYAMLLAGIGLIGFISYRRKNNFSNMLMAA